MSAPVFLAEGTDLTVFPAGSTYRLAGAEGRHAGVVQRRREGDRIDVVDGAGTRLRCTVHRVQSTELDLLVEDLVLEPEDQPSIHLVQALAKGDRDEQAVEAATEVGADGFIPWQADRSIVIWRGDRAAKSRGRWDSTVRAATKQSRRAHLARVEGVLDSPLLVERVSKVRTDGGAAILLYEEAETPLVEAHLPREGINAQILVIVGPEGGLSEREIQNLTDAGAQAVRLGPHVLRTSSAGPIAIAFLAHRLGRWAMPAEVSDQTPERR